MSPDATFAVQIGGLSVGGFAVRIASVSKLAGENTAWLYGASAGWKTGCVDEDGVGDAAC